MLTYLLVIALLLAALASWLWLRHWAHTFSQAHPEFGAHREEGQGCGACSPGGCGGRCGED